MGLLYKFGNGVEQSAEEAAKWFREAADAGDECALKELEFLGMEPDGE